ncbi:MetQ/NlpA family ABC transporter substrate-binding protein [Treponema sp. UBA3813]|uniref:MetQ/NlpA family ABC transporter substrate-binding protein n=1 Tax=Treponema sp. UBA3813 TaxID=1947715 RepID=UPI0025F3218B|nr:MetQ/NlpA family ABC transporter substrate-binding protein [Treponema sp. UBA3813]
MKKITKNSLRIALLTLGAVAVLSSFVSCNKKENSSSEKKTLTYSRSQGPYTVLFENGVAPILEAKGYTLKGIDYSELSLADDAVNGGDVDFNVEQHTAYAESYNKGNNGDLLPITPIPTVPASMFSSRYKSLSDIEKIANPKIAVPNDPANTARAYVLLSKIGWITLKDGVNLSTVTSEDIASNKYNIVFTEMKSLNIPQVQDDFDFVVITGSIVYNAGIDASTALAKESVLPHLVLQVVVKAENKDSQWAKDIVAAYHSAEFKAYLEKTNYENGLFWIPEDYSFN